MTVRGIVGVTVGLVALGAVLVPGAVQASAAAAGSRALAPAAQQSPKSIFQSTCSVCHGAEGKGNGPAGMALKPRPANFTDPAFWKTHTDSQLVDSITGGIGSMPAFGGAYDQATIRGLVKYLHVLSGLKSGGSTPGS